MTRKSIWVESRSRRWGMGLQCSGWNATTTGEINTSSHLLALAVSFDSQVVFHTIFPGSRFWTGTGLGLVRWEAIPTFEGRWVECSQTKSNCDGNIYGFVILCSLGPAFSGQDLWNPREKVPPRAVNSIPGKNTVSRYWSIHSAIVFFLKRWLH